MPGITNLATAASPNAKINKVKTEELLFPTKLLLLVFLLLKIKYLIIVNLSPLQKLTAENFVAKLAQANLASKSQIAIFAKKYLAIKLKN